MKQALIDIEDSRFYEHHGLDIEGTARALVRNVVAGEVMEGGSTITQQLVKQTLLQAATTAEERAGGDRVAASAASCARPGWPWPWRSSTRRRRSSPAT